ncbi:Integrase catalytic domain-containing protein, partial [Aphis craccivora]
MEFNKPENLKLIGNLNENFRLFKQEVEVYFMATETYKKTKEVQVARLLNLLGPDGLKLFNTFKIEEITVEAIFKSLEEYCVPKKNE